jgi:hypothetical protein
MSYDPYDDEMEAAREDYEQKVGEDYLKEFGHDLLYREHYEEAIKEFTAERLQSYYVAHPKLAWPARESLLHAESLMPCYPKAALVFATTASELAVKTVFLKPIVFGLVHTEGLASFITDLTTQHTRMERFQTLLAEILSKFGGADLKTYKWPGSGHSLWQEMVEIQKARNAVVHRGEATADSNAELAIAVAKTFLNEIFPLVLAKLELHLHEPMTVCAGYPCGELKYGM